jgi:acetyl esterase/lipase
MPLNQLDHQLTDSVQKSGRHLGHHQYSDCVATIVQGCHRALAANGHVKSQSIETPNRGRRTCRTILYKPTTDKEAGASAVERPLVVLIHGGGFCYGSPEMGGPDCVKAVERYGCIALSLSYRLASEHKFPAATDGCWDMLYNGFLTLPSLHGCQCNAGGCCR